MPGQLSSLKAIDLYREVDFYLRRGDKNNFKHLLEVSEALKEFVVEVYPDLDPSSYRYPINLKFVELFVAEKSRLICNTINKLSKLLSSDYFQKTEKSEELVKILNLFKEDNKGTYNPDMSSDSDTSSGRGSSPELHEVHPPNPGFPQMPQQ